MRWRLMTIGVLAILLTAQQPLNHRPEDPTPPELFQRLHDTSNANIARLTEFTDLEDLGRKR